MQDAQDRVSIYLIHDNGFSRKQDAQIQLPPDIRGIYAADVDNDRYADIIVDYQKGEVDAPIIPTKVFFARETAP